jgi:hypothetical protein
MHGLARNFHSFQFVRGLMGIGETVPWVGTWSLGRLPEILIYAGLLVGLVPCVSYLARLRQLPLAGWAPLALAAPMLVGLVHHVLIRIAIDGSGTGTPGWYLHVVAPALGVALALGWTAPRLTAALGAYAMTYALVAQAWQLSMFSGCAGLDAGLHFTLAGSSCFVDPRSLAALGHPALGALCLACGLASGLAALAVARPWRALKPIGQELSALTPLGGGA